MANISVKMILYKYYNKLLFRGDFKNKKFRFTKHLQECKRNGDTS